MDSMEQDVKSFGAWGVVWVIDSLMFHDLLL